MTKVSTTVLYERIDRIGYITLNRPEVLNALNDQWLIDLLAAARRARVDTECGVVIVRGNGRSFCAGADLKESPQPRPLAEWRATRLADMQEVARSFRLMGKPVLAQIQGHALGGGLELALLADIRIASENALFGLPETRVGATVTMGGLYNLLRAVGPGKTFELAYTTDMIDARAAEAAGLVNAVVKSEELESHTLALAEEILKKYKLETALTRASIHASLDLDFAGALAEEESAALLSFVTGNRKNGMAAQRATGGASRE